MAEARASELIGPWAEVPEPDPADAIDAWATRVVHRGTVPGLLPPDARNRMIAEVARALRMAHTWGATGVPPREQRAHPVDLFAASEEA